MLFTHTDLNRRATEWSFHGRFCLCIYLFVCAPLLLSGHLLEEVPSCVAGTVGCPTCSLRKLTSRDRIPGRRGTCQLVPRFDLHSVAATQSKPKRWHWYASSEHWLQRQFFMEVSLTSEHPLKYKAGKRC